MENKIIQKKEIQDRLKIVGKRVTLPRNIDFCIQDDTLYLTVKLQGVIKNMQEDCSAFEGWCICIKAALPEVNHVVLSWEQPANEVANLHYNRFLMRVASFLAEYSWFSIDGKHTEEVRNVQNLLNGECLYVNYPKSEAKEVVDEKKKPEAYRERMEVKKLQDGGLMAGHQLPVGLFDGKVSKSTSFTPRGASQVDLWQVVDKALRVFELKCKDNKKVGIISELMFYANTMYYLKEGLIRYPSDVAVAKDYRNFKELYQLIAGKLIDKIDAVFMVQELHPLFDAYKRKILEILNDNKFGIRYYIEEIE